MIKERNYYVEEILNGNKDFGVVEEGGQFCKVLCGYESDRLFCICQIGIVLSLKQRDLVVIFVVDFFNGQWEISFRFSVIDLGGVRLKGGCCVVCDGIKFIILRVQVLQVNGIVFEGDRSGG